MEQGLKKYGKLCEKLITLCAEIDNLAGKKKFVSENAYMIYKHQMKFLVKKKNAIDRKKRQILLNNVEIIIEYIRSGTEPQNYEMTKFLLHSDKIEYMRVNKINFNKTVIYCATCGAEIYGENNSYTCAYCGTYNVISHDFKRIRINSYQSKTYFIDYMNRFQAKKMPNLNQNDIDKLNKAVTRLGLTGREINISDMYRVLKAAGLNKFNKDRMYIMHKIFGIPLPCISQDDMNKFLIMYDEIALAWNDMFTDGMKYQYQYICRKIMEFYPAYDWCIKYWKICNDFGKLSILDARWKAVCERLNYEFIPTTYM